MSEKPAEEHTKVDKKPMSQPVGSARSRKVSEKKGREGVWMLSYDHTTTAASAMIAVMSVTFATVDARSAATGVSHDGSACLLLLREYIA